MTSEQRAPEETPRIELTDAAVAKLKEVLAGQPRPPAGLRLQIVGRTSQGFEHVLSVLPRGQERPDDVRVEVDGIPVYVEGKNVESLNGVKIHYQYKGPNVSGLEFDNPNPVWRDPLATRVQQLFDESINPSLAMHGGYVNLVDVQEKVAYIEMGGGCQGCGMADVTLKMGIEEAIRDQVPEIEEVVDVTDHAAGTNPYYQPSKK